MKSGFCLKLLEDKIELYSTGFVFIAFMYQRKLHILFSYHYQYCYCHSAMQWNNFLKIPYKVLKKSVEIHIICAFTQKSSKKLAHILHTFYNDPRQNTLSRSAVTRLPMKHAKNSTRYVITASQYRNITTKSTTPRQMSKYFMICKFMLHPVKRMQVRNSINCQKGIRTSEV